MEEVDTIHIFSQLPANVKVLDAINLIELSQEMFNCSSNGSVSNIAGKVV